jgi:hypothetical protein
VKSLSEFSSQITKARSQYNKDLQQKLTNGPFASWYSSNTGALGTTLQIVQNDVAQLEQLGARAFSNYQQLLLDNGVSEMELAVGDKCFGIF